MEAVPDADSTRSGSGQAVFVAEAPRRARYLRWTARIGALAASAYVVITAASLVGAPWVPHLSLPGVGTVTLEQHPTATPQLGPGAQALPTPTLTPKVPHGGTTSTSTPHASGTAPTPTIAPGASGRAVTSTTATARPGNGNTTTTSPSSATPTSAPPGHSGTAPGHTSTSVAHGH